MQAWPGYRSTKSTWLLASSSVNSEPSAYASSTGDFDWTSWANQRLAVRGGGIASVCNLAV